MERVIPAIAIAASLGLLTYLSAEGALWGASSALASLIVVGGAVSGGLLARMWQGTLGERITAHLLAYPLALNLAFGAALLWEWVTRGPTGAASLPEALMTIPVLAASMIPLVVATNPALALVLAGGLFVAQKVPPMIASKRG